MSAIDLGFVALTDAAPLIVAEARGFFEQEGLRVTLRREVSWATIRDKVAAGLYEGAHMLAPAALALSAGVGSESADVVVSLALNAHGAAIGVSAALASDMALHPAPQSAPALAAVAAQRRNAGRPALSFAVVFPYSIHNYMLRVWLASAGLDPERDVRIVVAPPTGIAARLRSGEIDGFGVGAPWGDLCAEQSGARILLEAGAFWPGGPDKVLGLSGAWAAREPEAALALTRAVLRACVWADAHENRAELAELLSGSVYVGAPAPLIARKLGVDTPTIRFARAAFPWRAHACWILSQMLRWDQLRSVAALEPALASYRPDLFTQASADLGLAAAQADVNAPLPAFGAAEGAFDEASLVRFAQSRLGGA
jgi:ABC-type nitrate/sulfonate/bicarbonate transport system substrate-binding protein